MNYYKAHPRKAEAIAWHKGPKTVESMGACNMFDIWPNPNLAIPEWEDPEWKRRLPSLTIKELNRMLSGAMKRLDELYEKHGRDMRRMKEPTRKAVREVERDYYDAMNDLQLLDPFWRGQVRGEEAGHGKRLWREERESYEALVAA